MLNYVKSAGGLQSINSEREWGAQSLKIKTGTSSIAWALAAALPPGSMQINAPINAISQHGDHAIVRTSSGAVYEARRVILAIPTNTYTAIRFSPPASLVEKGAGHADQTWRVCQVSRNVQLGLVA